MLDFTPNPIALQVGPLPIYWYGIAYAVGIAAVYWVVAREARFRGLNEELIGTGIIVIAVAALIGGRLYHVIDQWQLYAPHPLTAFLPLTVRPDGSYAFSGFTGLGVPEDEHRHRLELTRSNRQRNLRCAQRSHRNLQRRHALQYLVSRRL